jgi:hypothetical protein
MKQDRMAWLLPIAFILWAVVLFVVLFRSALFSS